MPNKPMVNYVCRELALCMLEVPIYTPFIAPNMADGPWPVPASEQKSDVAKWNSDCQSGKSARPHPLPLNARVL